MKHITAINRAHDLRQPFCYLQYREDGTIAVITPYYMEKLPEPSPTIQ